MPNMAEAGTPWMSITAMVSPLVNKAWRSETVSFFQETTFGIN
jgi:hypothetical protein